ncbi:MAG: peptidoglycan DD-metalloendopeptidase family protein [Pseudomonadota bacterium]
MGLRSALSVLLCGTTLVGCGASINSAPVVYGTQPSSGTRVFNSPAQVYLSQSQAQEEAATVQPAAITSPGAPTALTPVFVSELEAVSSPPAAWSVGSNGGVRSSNSVTVQPGDTVYGIARRTGFAPNEIVAVNGLRAPFSLQVGDVLQLPQSYQQSYQAQANTLRQPASVDAYSPTNTVFSAPVQERPVRSGRAHVVRSGDTLFAISRSTGVPVAELAAINDLRAPYRLEIGDRVYLSGAATAQRSTTPSVNGAALTKEIAYTNIEKRQPTEALFSWPVRGAILSRFGDGDLGRRNEGVNIAAPVGTPVRAAAGGEVVYRGSEVEGYGNLLLIKHDDDFVTAYAHNDVVLVRKGQKVSKGQVIAKVGQSGAATQPQLHFEVRQNLKSVDPLALLSR